MHGESEPGPGVMKTSILKPSWITSTPPPPPPTSLSLSLSLANTRARAPPSPWTHELHLSTCQTQCSFMVIKKTTVARKQTKAKYKSLSMSWNTPEISRLPHFCDFRLQRIYITQGATGNTESPLHRDQAKGEFTCRCAVNINFVYFQILLCQQYMCSYK